MSKPTVTKKSYGIICTKYNRKSDRLEFLFVQRRNSYSYIDFVLKVQMARSRTRDMKIMHLLNTMTSDEKYEIKSFDYARLWYRIWCAGPGSNSKLNVLTPDATKNYMLLERNFKERFFNPDQGQKLIEMIDRSRSIERMWEIPKGRKNFGQEKDLSCAIREFEEETYISPADYRIINEMPLEVTIVDDDVKYIQIYYLAVLTTNSDPLRQFQQNPEISDMQWLDMDKIRILCQNPKIINLVKHANDIFRKKYKIQKLTELGMIPA